MSAVTPPNSLAAIEVAPGIWAGEDAPSAAVPLSQHKLLVLVGVTGVGKSTTLQHLADSGAAFTLLPDRRRLTDCLIIGSMQAAEGKPPTPVIDRRERFAYTRRFREQHAGGMADALRLLSVIPDPANVLLVFDGLRGENEVEAAIAHLPLARFVMLDAPDAVRVVRLLGRDDPFDHIGGAASGAPTTEAFVASGLSGDEAKDIFSPLEQRLLLELVTSGAVPVEDLRARVAIVLEERRSYDPAATRRLLADLGGANALIVDTTAVGAAEAARLIIERMTDWWAPVP